MTPSYAILSAGNFWNLQDVFEHTSGIISTQVGYTGGFIPNPSYHDVASGQSGHVEAVKLIFNSDIINYETILETFFASHNPTYLLSQSTGMGSQYRSAIFYYNDIQKAIAQKQISKQQKKYNSPILTEVRAVSTFYPAEQHHQHYITKAGQTSCCLSSNC